MLRYAMLVIVFMLMLHGGAVVLADSENVALTHPLYPYKRLGEDLRLSIAPVASRAALRSKFAERRLEEMQEAKKKTMKRQKLEVLNNDFKREVNAALASADTVQGISTSTRMSLCGALQGLIRERDALMHKGRITKWSGFASHCKEFSGTDTFPVQEE